MKKTFPNNRNIIRCVNELREYLFFEHFQDWREHYADYTALEEAIRDKLTEEIASVLKGKLPESREIVTQLFDQLPAIKILLDKDAEAGYWGDPAARSVDEVILSYPGFFTVLVHRIAHCLFLLNVPLIPRMMSEYAHSKTGIDIHPGAVIGEYFFIDHGTGVVIGETTLVGNNVKIYQGVTLGALSTRKGQKLAGIKRHPTIEDNVTIYAGATILGGNTLIGRDSVIGGNAFVVESLPAGTQISGNKI